MLLKGDSIDLGNKDGWMYTSRPHQKMLGADFGFRTCFLAQSFHKFYPNEVLYE